MGTPPIAARSPTVMPFWRNQRVRRLALQGIFLGLVAVVAAYIVDRATGLDLDLDYLSGPASFPISTQWLTGYSASDTRLDAYLTGVVNTARLVAIGLVLTTILGTAVGIARLSSNWLVSRLATFYVETIRNTPLLVQVIFWYFAVFLQLPRIEDAINAFDGLYVTNRGIALPFVNAGGAFGIWIAILGIALIATWYLRRRLRKREEESGRPGHARPIALLTFALIGAIGFAATGAPLSANVPSLITPRPASSPSRTGSSSRPSSPPPSSPWSPTPAPSSPRSCAAASRPCRAARRKPPPRSD